MNEQDLKTVLELHRKWVLGEDGGARADLAGADLAGADLAGADLAGADLAGADLAGAYLAGANLARANLADANLARANLADANLADAYLARANLADANLAGANLAGANLAPIRDDLVAVLERAKPEVRELYKAIVDGKINGTVYEGDCACLVGTIANARHVRYTELADIAPDSQRPAERWFLGIKRGDTPENNPVAAITRGWVEDFMRANDIAVPVRQVTWVEP